ncbi:IPT/TIG domain-containing protein [Candidatus Saccharibacteria bacterium]|nr:IPT/TIG domain-containing protein [Candidatus Saccharibacteria bacterium]
MLGVSIDMFGRQVPILLLVLFVFLALGLSVALMLFIRRHLKMRGLARSSGIYKLYPSLKDARSKLKIEVIDINALVRKHKNQRILLQLLPSVVIPCLVLVGLWALFPATQALNVSTVSPNQGPDTGNQQITITGTDFLQYAGVDQMATIDDGYSCSLMLDGQIYCAIFNSNPYGDSGSYTLYPLKQGDMPSGAKVEQISGGHAHACAVADGQAYCWGENASGQLGDGTDYYDYYDREYVITPIAVKTDGVLAGLTIKQISAGYYHTCAIAGNANDNLSDAVYCWGDNGGGQLGIDGDYYTGTHQSLEPVAVETNGIWNGLTVKQISAGAQHTCAIAGNANDNTNDQAYCWGANGAGQLGVDDDFDNSYQSFVPVAVDTSDVLDGLIVKQISAGNERTCAIAGNANDNTSDQAYCWGYNDFGELGNGKSYQDDAPSYDGVEFLPVAVETSGVLSGLVVKYISVGNRHTCAIAGNANDNTNDQAYCWGDNREGELGLGYEPWGGDPGFIERSSVPVAVDTGRLPNGVTSSKIEAGGYYASCILGSDQQLYCWGYSVDYLKYEGLSFGDDYDWSPTPINMPRATPEVTVGGEPCRSARPISDTEITCVTSAHSAGVVDVSVTINGETQVLVGAYEYIPLAVTAVTPGSGPIAGGQTITVNGSGFKQYDYGAEWQQVAANQGISCGITTDNRLYCWGKNYYGQFGNGTRSWNNDEYKPVLSDTLDSPLYGKVIKQVAVAYNHVCAVAGSAGDNTNDQAYCWGYNGSGQLGADVSDTPYYYQSFLPVAVDTSDALSGLYIKQISASGYYHTCAIASDDQAYCWGYNGSGQLGVDDDFDNSYQSFVPVPVDTNGVLNGLIVKQISASHDYTCVIAGNANDTTADAVYCWGANWSGQLGVDNDYDTGTPQSYEPVAVDTSNALSGLTIKQISSGGEHTCVIASDDQVYCWGANWSGQLGVDNDYSTGTYQSYEPVAVDTSDALSGLTAKQISSGGEHTCVIASDDQAYCWGANWSGTLGVDDDFGGNGTSYMPVAVDTSDALSGLTAKQISAGYNHTCAIASDGQIYCWGSNSYGEIGLNAGDPDYLYESFVPVPVDSSGVFGSSKPGVELTVKLDGLECTNVTIVSDSELTCVTPAHSPGFVNIVVSVNNNDPTPPSASLNSAYEYERPLIVTAITPDRGPITGGQQVTITGEAFEQGSQIVPPSVTLGGAPCTNVVVVSDTKLTCTTPIHAAGSVNVSVDIGNQTATLPYAYTYYKPTTVTSITPNYGIEAGGTSVTITGSGFERDLEWKQVSTGVGISGNHTCAITSDGKAYCWGSNYSGRLGVDYDENNGGFYMSTVPVAVDTSGLLNGLFVKQISAGTYHTCAIAGNANDTSDDKVYCWGANWNGQLGVDNDWQTGINESYEPVAVGTTGPLSSLTVKQISAGVNHTCVIASDDKAYCWGYNYGGELGNGKDYETPGYDGYEFEPVAVDTTGVLNGLAVKQISVGDGHGYSHTCVVAGDAGDSNSDKVYCWGGNNLGELGIGENDLTSVSNVPVAVDTSGVLAGKTILSVTAGQYHTCVIASDNQAYCWGYNGLGQVGSVKDYLNTPGYYGYEYLPVAVDTSGVLSGLTIKHIEAGYLQTCAIAGNANNSNVDRAYCWGDNGSGELGVDYDQNNGGIYNGYVPVAVDTSGLLDGLSVKQTSTGYGHTCAIAGNTSDSSNDKVYCWGRNHQGELGVDDDFDEEYVSYMPVTIDTTGLPKQTPTVIFDINGTPAVCTDVVVISDTELTCTTSAHVPGLVDVTVKVGGISGTLPAVCDVANSTACNGMLDSGEARGDDRTNVTSGFLYEEIYITLDLDSVNVTLDDSTLDGIVDGSAAGTFATASNALTTATNSPSGYRLSIETLKGHSNLNHTSLSDNIIPVIGTFDPAFATASALGINQWGFTLNPTQTASALIWSLVPPLNSPIQIKSTNTANETGDSTAIFYGTNINAVLPSGNYSTQVRYTVVADF